MLISRELEAGTLDFLHWFVLSGCCDNPSRALVEEQYDRARTLLDKWQDAVVNDGVQYSEATREKFTQKQD